MNADQWTKLLEVLVSLLQAISWPLIILFILFALRTPLKKLLEDKGISNLTIKAGPTGIEAMVKRQQIEAAISLGAAQAKQIDNQASDMQSVQTIANVVDQVVTPLTSQKVLGKIMLWVDDMPYNNSYERKALEALGITITICISTEDAIKLLQHQKFDVIISDMGRPPDPRAGYTLLEKVQEMKITTPFIIYSIGGKEPEHVAEARRRGAFGSTSGADGLFVLVVRALTET